MINELTTEDARMNESDWGKNKRKGFDYSKNILGFASVASNRKRAWRRRNLGQRTRATPRDSSSLDKFFPPFDLDNITMESSNCATAIDSDTLAKRLRLELKEWEQSFAAANHGRKAGREDIKQHPEIGQKLPVCYLSPSFTDEPSTQVQAV